MNERTTEERVEQVITLIKKMRDFGFPKESTGMTELRKKCNEFIKTGKRWDGKIKFIEYNNITLVITLCSKKTVECSITIKH